MGWKEAGGKRMRDLDYECIKKSRNRAVGVCGTEKAGVRGASAWMQEGDGVGLGWRWR